MRSLHPDVARLLDADQAAAMRAWRQAAGMTQAAWAREMGVSERTARSWEAGARSFSYAEQHLAERVVLREACRGIAEEVLLRGGDERGCVLAETLYASGRAARRRAVERGLEWSAALGRMGL